MRLTEPSNIRIASLASSTLPIVTNANPLLLSVTRSYTIYRIQSNKIKHRAAIGCTTKTLNSSIKQGKRITKTGKRRNLNRRHGASFSKELAQFGISDWIWQVSNIEPPSIIGVWNLLLFLLFCFFNGFWFWFVLLGLCGILSYFQPIKGSERWGKTVKWEKGKSETLGLEVETEWFLRYGSLREVAAGEWKGRVCEGKVVYSVADRRGNRSRSSHWVNERKWGLRFQFLKLRSELSVERGYNEGGDIHCWIGVF